jgi:hypothetical protein
MIAHGSFKLNEQQSRHGMKVLFQIVCLYHNVGCKVCSLIENNEKKYWLQLGTF